MNNFKPLLLILLISLYGTGNAADTWNDSTNFHPPMAQSQLLPPETGEFEDEGKYDADIEDENNFDDEDEDWSDESDSESDDEYYDII